MADVNDETKEAIITILLWIGRVIVTVFMIAWVITSALIFGGIKGAAKSKPPSRAK